MNRMGWGHIGAVLLCAANFAFAGGSTGGGNVVVCTEKDTGIERVRLLDYFEAEQLMPELVPSLGKGTTEVELVQNALTRLAKLDRDRAESYLQEASTFFIKTRFVTGVVLPNINDHGYVPLPANCRIEQIAVQNISPFPEVKRYTIRKEYWERLSLIDRAGLILHEVIYLGALAQGHKTSINSRYFNCLVSSDRLESMSGSDYRTRLDMLGLLSVSPQPVNHPPRWLANPVALSKAAATQAFKASLHSFVADPEMDPLTFSKMSGPSWLMLSADGTVSGTPTENDQGENRFVFGVKDPSGGGDTTTVNVIVTAKPPSPVVVLPEAIEGMMYSADLSPHTAGCKRDTIFTILGGPAWLALSSTGKVSGTPRLVDVGTNLFRIAYRCTDLGGLFYAEITVRRSPNPPAIASHQNFLWVVDNSGSFDRLRKAISKAMGTFVTELGAAGVKQFDMGVITTDSFNSTGNLVGGKLISGEAAQSEVFRQKFEGVMTKVEDSLTSFWEQGLEASYHSLVEHGGSSLIQPGVPLSVIYVSDEDDYSCQDKCFGVEPENNKDWVSYPVERYTDMFRQIAGKTKASVKVFPIIYHAKSKCELASIGKRYQLVQEIIGGLTGSVCEDEIEASVLAITKALANR